MKLIPLTPDVKRLEAELAAKLYGQYQQSCAASRHFGGSAGGTTLRGRPPHY